jgi:8-oxo-dGTP pyrophosphatase MutT (NUDIX family)
VSTSTPVLTHPVDTIRRNLAAFARTAADPEAGRTAAVAVCVLDSPQGHQVLIIKRAARGLNSGQWALPGGRLEPHETPLQAALREVHEEVGLQLTEDCVVGTLDDYITDSGFVITPIVALVPGSPKLRRNPSEVHSLHRIALSRLLAPDVPRWAVAGNGAPLLQMPLRHDIVMHAPTGAILLQFREVALLGRAISVVDLQEPVFTRH